MLSSEGSREIFSTWANFQTIQKRGVTHEVPGDPHAVPGKPHLWMW